MPLPGAMPRPVSMVGPPPQPMGGRPNRRGARPYRSPVTPNAPPPAMMGGEYVCLCRRGAVRAYGRCDWCLSACTIPRRARLSKQEKSSCGLRGSRRGSTCIHMYNIDTNHFCIIVDSDAGIPFLPSDYSCTLSLSREKASFIWITPRSWLHCRLESHVPQRIKAKPTPYLVIPQQNTLLAAAA